MACGLLGAKPLIEPMLFFCQLASWEQISEYLNGNSVIFIQENAFQDVVCKLAAILCRGDELNSDKLSLGLLRGSPQMNY